MKEDISRYREVPVWLPDQKQVKKIVSVPHKVKYINLAAAPGANVIKLVQGSAAIDSLNS